MNLNGLTLRNLFYHGRSNLAVLLGVAVGTAVLTGALLVGDALRYSLTRLTEERLGWVDQAVIGTRFLRQDLAEKLPAEGVAPILLLRGTARAGNKIARKVQILGVDDRFWNRGQSGEAHAAVTVNAALAHALDVQAGQKVTVSLLKAGDIPRETLLGEREGDAAIGTATFTVANVLTDDAVGAKFSLQPSLDTVRTLYVPLPALQQALEQPGKVNGFLLRGADPAAIEKALHANLTLEDLGLKIYRPEDRVARLMNRLDRNRDGVLKGTEWYRRKEERNVPRFAAALADAVVKANPDEITRGELEAHYRATAYLSLESKSLLLEPAIDRAARAAAREVGFTAAPTLVYLANTLAEGPKALPYVLVAGIDPTLPPLGSKILPGGLPDDRILLVKWPGSPLTYNPGEKVHLTFYPPEQHGEYTEVTADLISVGGVDLKGALVDPDLTPEFPGVTDKDDVSGWKPPFKFDNSRVKGDGVSEPFWEGYRTTPRAYVNLATAERLFGSRFGKATALRLYARAGGDEAALLAAFREKLLTGLTAEQLGLVARSVRAEGLQASGGAMNFAGLFLGFSFFLIAAALLLVGLLFRLNLERRAREIGLLATAGYPPVTLRRLLLVEGLFLALAGSALGLIVAVGYSRLLVQLMQLLWPGGMLNSFLRPSWTWSSLLIGYASSVVVSVVTISRVVRGMAKVPPRLLIAGKTTDENDLSRLAKRPGRWQWVALAAVVPLGLLLLVVAFYVPGHEAQAGTFFGSGALFLTAGMLIVSLWLRATSPTPLRPNGGLWQLAGRNLARNPGRSLLTVGLLASASFLLVAVESFRPTAHATHHDKNSPDGGFALLGEAELPIVRDLTSEEGQGELLDALQGVWQKQNEADIPARLQEARKRLASLEIVPFRARDGDDASCLNLYEPRRPRVLGVPSELIRRGGFVFADSEAKEVAQVKNPWLLLTDPEPGQPIPAFGEQNTVIWMLHTGLGGTVPISDAGATPVNLRVAGLLKDSVFQSALLIDERAFLRLYPGQEGYRFFLIKCPPGDEEKVRDLLQLALESRGFTVETAAERLKSYLAIENTYLSTFQALGGLGLILGSLGLAVVLLRSVWERQGELALLQALGYRHSHLMSLILIENVTLLFLGLLVGLTSALLSITPQLVARSAALPWPSLLLLLGAVVAVGFTATYLATRAALRAPLQPGLRRE